MGIKNPIELYLGDGEAELLNQRLTVMRVVQNEIRTLQGYVRLPNNIIDEEHRAEFIRAVDDSQALFDECNKAIDAHIQELCARYLQEKGADGIAADAIDVIGQADLDEYAKYLSEMQVKEPERRADKIDIFREFLECNLYFQLEALKGDVEKTEQIKALVTAKANSYWPNVQNTLPEKWIATLDKVSDKTFSGALTSEIGKGEVRLIGLDSKRTKVAQAGVIYDELAKKGLITTAPELTQDDRDVLEAVTSLIVDRNVRTMTIREIYKAKTGKVSERVDITNKIIDEIKNSLRKFNGRIIISYDGVNKDGKSIKVRYDEPLLMYAWSDIAVNGQLVDGAITVPDSFSGKPYVPPLFRWASEVCGEYATIDITLRNVKGINSGSIGEKVKSYLFRRIAAMEKSHDKAKKARRPMKMSRIIRLDTLYEAIGVRDPDKNQRHDIKKAVEKCIKKWTDEGWFLRAEFKRDKAQNNSYDKIEILFEENPPKWQNAQQKAK